MSTCRSNARSCTYRRMQRSKVSNASRARRATTASGASKQASNQATKLAASQATRLARRLSKQQHARADALLHLKEHVQEQWSIMHVQEQARKQRKQCKRSTQSNHSKRSKQIHQQAHARLHVQIRRCMPKRKASNASIVSTASGASKYALGRSV